MGSEGYFLNQFLAPRTNRRADAWGGSPENRMRLPVEVVRRVRDALGPDGLLIYRISLIDLVPDGQTWDEVVTLARAVQSAGADVLNSGIGWHEARVPTIATSVPRAAFAWLTARLRPEVTIPVIACNRINTPEVAEGILARGEADMVSLARPFLADPDFVVKAAGGRAGEIAPCIACNQACLDHTFAGKLTSCLVNPRACHETEIVLTPAPTPRRIAVIGAGPAGLSCAITAADRGHHVTLFEVSGRIGGQLNLARRIPGKEEFDGLVDWYGREVARAGVRLRLNAAPALADLADFEAVVIATGVAPRAAGLPGEDGPNVLSYVQVLEGAPVGPRVAVVGAGGIGFDVAAFLVAAGHSSATNRDLWQAEWGVGDPAATPGGLAADGPRPTPPARQVTLLQRRPGAPGKSLGKTTGWIHRAHLSAMGVRMLGGVTYEGIEPGGLRVRMAEDAASTVIPADTIVICAGQVPRHPEVDPAALAPGNLHVIGGAASAAELDAKRAIDQGVRLAARL
jgi:2,4-dienoyl-CoA reductase (NADPH2)